MTSQIPKLIQSETVYLRPLTLLDANENYLSWLSDKEVNRFLESRFKTHTIEYLKTYIGNFDQKNQFLFGIFDISSDAHIGNITLDNSPHNVTYFGYLIGNKSYWGTPAATEAIYLAIEFTFKVIKARKIWGGISKSNMPAIFNIHRFGFKREGTLRSHVTDQGRIVDVLQYGLLKEEWSSSQEKFSHLKKTIK